MTDHSLRSSALRTSGQAEGLTSQVSADDCILLGQLWCDESPDTTDQSRFSFDWNAGNLLGRLRIAMEQQQSLLPISLLPAPPHPDGQVPTFRGRRSDMDVMLREAVEAV